MAGGKETPRQKMIGIMYLVLMAMLALNVSDTILNAFSTINNSLKTSTTNVNTGLTQSVNAFEVNKMKENPARAKPILDKIKATQNLAGELDGYIQSLKDEIIAQGDGIDPETGEIRKRDNLDISPRILWNEGKGKGYILQKKINDTRVKLMNLLDPKDRSEVSFSLEANNPVKRSTSGTKLDWVETNFGEGIPLTAAVTILTKIQADSKNAENSVVKKFISKMDESLVNLDKFQAVAVAPSSYVIQGQPYTAEVFLTAYDSQLTPDITVGGSRLPAKDGKGLYSVNTSKEGEFKWIGTIRYKKTDGTIVEAKTPEQTYRVARPSAVVSPDKMNVFYIGVPNPVSVSAPGIAKEKLRVNISGGSISGANGSFTVRVNGGTKAIVSVSADAGNGKIQALGSSNFRIKRVPDPYATFAGSASGPISRSSAIGVNRLEAALDNFDFELKFRVVKFNIAINKPGQDPLFYTSPDGSFSGQIRTAVNRLSPGDVVSFNSIVVDGEDGSKRQLKTGINVVVRGN
jgi:gliding motility-associated protein GldM